MPFRIMSLPILLSVACMSPDGEIEAADEKSDQTGVEAALVSQECKSAEALSIVDAFSLHYTVDGSTQETLLSAEVEVQDFVSDLFTLGEEEALAEGVTTASLKVQNWQVSSETLTFTISDRDNGTTGDIMLLLTPDYDGERTIGFLKFTSDGFIGSSLVECGPVPFDSIAEVATGY